MLCPKCDGILNIRGCVSCGWQHGDPWEDSRLTPDAAFPLKIGGHYPNRIPSGSIVLKDFGKVVEAVEQEAGVEVKIVDNFFRKVIDSMPSCQGTAKSVLAVPASKGGGPVSNAEVAGTQPGTGQLQLIPDPITKTVQ